MKKFKYPLAITGTLEEREALIPKLKELGYVWKAIARNDGSKYNLLRTNYGPGGLGYHYDPSVCMEVPASNPELVLALAAAVDDAEIYKGECVIFTDQHNHFTPGKLYVAQKAGWDEIFLFINDRGAADGWGGGGNRKMFRKASKEEIVAHFDKPSVLPIKEYNTIDLGYLSGITNAFPSIRSVGKLSSEQILNCHKTPLTVGEFIELLGNVLKTDTNPEWWGIDPATPKESNKMKKYVLKKEFESKRSEISKLVFLEPFDEGSAAYYKALQFGVLDLWFEVAKEEKTVGVKRQNDENSLIVRVTKDKITGEFLKVVDGFGRNVDITPKDLERIVNLKTTFSASEQYDLFQVTPEVVTIGCQRGFLFEDIEKVWEAYQSLQ